MRHHVGVERDGARHVNADDACPAGCELDPPVISCVVWKLGCIHVPFAVRLILIDEVLVDGFRAFCVRDGPTLEDVSWALGVFDFDLLASLYLFTHNRLVRLFLALIIFITWLGRRVESEVMIPYGPIRVYRRIACHIPRMGAARPIILA